MYNLRIFNKEQIVDTTMLESPNPGGYIVQKWIEKCNDLKTAGRKKNFIKSMNCTFPTPKTGVNSLLAIGVPFMYIDTSGNNFGSDVVVSFERTDFVQINKTTLF